MPKSKRGGSKLKRTVGSRSPKKRVVVVCEGLKTEPNYLRLVNASTSSALVELLVVDEKATSPKQIVERACFEKNNAAKLARRTKDPNAAIDEIWCAFDVDQHPLLKEARQQAESNGIHLAISNPSIELWFLLHFENQTAHIHRDDALHKVKTYMKDYDKTLQSLDALNDKLTDANERARKLDEKHEGDGTNFPENNPSSGMWRLVESLGAKY
jgi:hypothetical protein